jgi:hypothetical protein
LMEPNVEGAPVPGVSAVAAIAVVLAAGASLATLRAFYKSPRLPITEGAKSADPSGLSPCAHDSKVSGGMGRA